MAQFQKGKAPGKRPVFNIRARTDPGNDASFTTIGACWEIEVDGKLAYSVKLHSIPINWDGSCLMVVPKESKEDPKVE